MIVGIPQKNGARRDRNDTVCIKYCKYCKALRYNYDAIVCYGHGTVVLLYTVAAVLGMNY